MTSENQNDIRKSSLGTNPKFRDKSVFKLPFLNINISINKYINMDGFLTNITFFSSLFTKKYLSLK